MNYDSEPIIVHTPYTFKQMKTLHRYHVRRISYILSGIWGVILLFAMLSSALPSESEASFVDIFQQYIPIILILLISIIFLNNSYTKKKHETATKLLKNGQMYYFRNGKYDAISKNDAYTGKDTYSYDALHGVRETAEMFYLYINKAAVMLIDKAGFQKGTPEELRLLLRRSLPAQKCKRLFK